MLQSAAEIVFVTDSTVCLPQELVDSNSVTVVPLRVESAGKSYLEGVDVTVDDLVEFLAAKQLVSTSQPSPAAFATAYQDAFLAGAKQVVSVHISAELSGTYQAALQAAKTARLPVTVVDSRTAALTMGFLIKELADAEAESAEEHQSVAGTFIEKAKTFFLVDNFDQLRRGGRISSTAAAMGTALAMKPVLHLKDGKIEVFKKIRTRNAARKFLLESAIEWLKEEPTGKVGLQYLDTPEVANELAARIETATGVRPEVTRISAVIAAHVGLGIIGLSLTN